MSTRLKANKRNFSPIKKLLIVLFSIIIGLIVGCVAIGFAYVSQIASQMDEYDDSVIFNLAKNSKIYASDGETVLAELHLENREPIESLSEVSPYLIKATISTEDSRFYEHKGVDILSLFRAASVILTGGNTQGGSTITMQLVRNTILSSQAQSITIERKLSEIFLATRVEEMFNKDQILLMYLNTINYGDRCYGIKAASKHYFSIDPLNLNLDQSATLAGIPQSPSYLSPTYNAQSCKNRRDIVLYRMYDDHMIHEAEYNAATAKDIELNLSYADYGSNYKYPYFTNYIREQILEQYSTSEILEGGFQIYTTLDVGHQEACEKGCRLSNDKLEKGAESVAVTMDPSNGYITGMVGGADFETNQYNIATSKGRPTGSSFKAFTLTAAIEQGYDPNSYTVDCSSPMTIGDITVNNYGKTSYGDKTIQGALAISSNTGFVRLQQKLDANSVINMARKLGVKKAYLEPITTLTLGQYDINPVEMATAFSTIANGGIYHEAVSILKIETASGNEIYSYNSNENPENGLRAIDEKVAGAAIKALETVFTKGTAKSAQLDNGQPVAGKTGTSEDYRDHTLIGFTPNLCLATWIGKRDYTSTSSSVSCNFLWKTIMDTITEKQDVVNFKNIEDPDYTKTNDNIKPKTSEDKLKYVPNVVGDSLQMAKATLSEYNLAIYYQYSDTVENGYIISQGQENGRIVLNVSKGKKPN